MLEDFNESFKYNKFSMGSQFDGDTMTDELNKGFYQRKIKLIDFKKLRSTFLTDLGYVEFREVE